MIRVILVALDGSRMSEQALPVAAELAAALKAKLILVCVAGPDAVVDQALTEQDRQAITEQYAGVREEDHMLSFDPRRVEHAQEQIRAIAEAERYLEGVKAGMGTQGIEIETAVPYGAAAEGILTEVDVRKADMVVLATHSHTGFNLLHGGSVAKAVLGHSPVPVLVVPPVE